jgi:hypothetical protein
MRIPSIAICALAAALVGGVAATAQTLDDLREKTPEELASDQTDFWARTLGLNKEQASALQQVNLRYATDMSLTAKSETEDDQKLATLETLEQERSEEVAELLTPAQRERYTDLTQQMERFVMDHTR